MQKNKMTIFLAVLTSLWLGACAKSNTVNNQDSSAAKTEFLNEFSGKASTQTSSLTIRQSGSIRYVNKVNDNCKLTFEGQIDSVQSSDGYYTVSYRFDSYTPYYPRCRHSDSMCALDVADCKRAIRDYDRIIGQKKTSLFKRGTNPDHVIMQP